MPTETSSLLRWQADDGTVHELLSTGVIRPTMASFCECATCQYNRRICFAEHGFWITDNTFHYTYNYHDFEDIDNLPDGRIRYPDRYQILLSPMATVPVTPTSHPTTAPNVIIQSKPMKKSLNSPILRVAIVRSKTGALQLRMQSDIFPMCAETVAREHEFYNADLHVHVGPLRPQYQINFDNAMADTWLFRVAEIRAGFSVDITPDRPISTSIIRSWLTSFMNLAKQNAAEYMTPFTLKGECTLSVVERFTVHNTTEEV